MLPNLNGIDTDCISNTTGTDIFEHYLLIKAFPNPSNGNIFIESKNPINTLKIKDHSGKVVLELRPQKRKVQIQTSHLKNSFYFLSCLIEQEWITKKIILIRK